MLMNIDFDADIFQLINPMPVKDIKNCRRPS